MEDKPGYIVGYNVWPDGRSEPVERWRTVNSHPYSGLHYQEWEGKARVILEGREVVSPSTDMESVYAQYQAKVQRVIND